MENKQIKVKVSTEDILKGKFAATISELNGVYKEIVGDKELRVSYSTKAVEKRIKIIKEAFEKDLADLAKSITLD